MPRTQHQTDTTTAAPDEAWTVVQVASFLAVSYQVARNNMLAGDYGLSEYDPVTRKLTVRAESVRAAKAKKVKKRTKK